MLTLDIVAESQLMCSPGQNDLHSEASRIALRSSCAD
jgi:hypothetical protein